MNFQAEKWSYDDKRSFRYGLQDYMRETFKFEEWKGKKVLEFGCGSGIDAVEFARNGAEVTAVDITDNACKLTSELSSETGLPIKVVKITDDILPFAENTFDCVYSYGVLHHIPDVEHWLGELHRVLKKDGTIMAMLYNRDSLLFAYSILYLHGFNGETTEVLKETPANLTSMYSERIESCPYTKAYTKDEARELFGRWFSDVQVSVHYSVIDLPEQRKVKIGIDDKYELGWHLVIKAIKEN